MDNFELITMDNYMDFDRPMEERVESNSAVESDEPPLCQACRSFDLATVKSLIKSNVDVSSPGRDGKTPLHIICDDDGKKLNGDNIMDLLLSNGALVDAQDNMGMTPLFLACIKDNVKFVEKLIQNNCDINTQSVSGESPMKTVCKNAEFWFYWHSKDNNGSDATSDPNLFPPVQLAKILLQAGVSPLEGTFLPAAVHFADLNIIKDLLDLGMDVNMLDYSRRTPLGSACSINSVKEDVVKLLLQHGADVNKGGGWKRQKPLIFAYAHNAVEKIRLLLSYGAIITPEEMNDLVSVSLSKCILENPEVIEPQSKELMSWHLLTAAGFQLSIQESQGTSASSLTSKIHQLSMCSSYEKIEPWIQMLLFPIRSLKQWCRIVIRANLQPCIDNHIQQLDLPETLKDYLVFREFSETKQ